MAIDDCGTIINPLIVEGQIHGGLAQGIGQALIENCVYDTESGQLLSGSLMDYALPRAADLPFDSDGKMMATRHPDPAAPRQVFIKGAPEAVLRLCAADGEALLHAARHAVEGMAGRALRG